MKFVRNYKVLLLIFLLAFCLRVVLLNHFPLGFHADEVRVAWNSYSILKTGRDDRGNLLALYYNTFGDYRPTGIFYFSIPSIIFFGLTQFATRFPSSLFGALTVFPIFLLTKEITKSKHTGYLTAFFLALTPWHWMVSRATSEAIISLFFGVYGIYFLIEALKKGKKKTFILSIVSFAISCLLYHSARPLVPLFAITTLGSYWNKIKRTSRQSGVISCIILSVFVLILLIGKDSLGRFNQVSINNNVHGVETSQPFIYKLRDQYLSYFSGDFLIGDSPKPYRYRVLGVSLLGSAITCLLILGVIEAVQKRTSKLPLLLLLLSPLPAALTNEDSPNLHRALFMLPFILIIAGTGAVMFFRSSIKGKIITSVFLLIFMFTAITSVLSYFGNGSLDAAPYRNFAVDKMIFEISQKQGDYDHVILTNNPDSPYPWFAFYNKLDPSEFNLFAIQRTQSFWKYKNIIFTTNSCPAADSFDKKSDLKGRILVVDGPGCEKKSILHDILGVKIVDEISDPDGSVVYRLWEKTN